jgi:acyl carrier protein
MLRRCEPSELMGLATVELVMAVEEELKLEIPDTAAEKLIAVGEMHAFLAGELRRLGRVSDDAEIFERMRAIIVRQLGVSPDEVVSNAQFVKDLRAD